MSDTLEQMEGLLPFMVVTGGLVMPMTNWIQRQMDEGPVMQGQNRARRRDKRQYGKAMEYKGMRRGDFSNVGF